MKKETQPVDSVWTEKEVTEQPKVVAEQPKAVDKKDKKQS